MLRRLTRNGRTPGPILTIALLALVALGSPSLAQAQTTYDLADFDFSFNGGTDIQGTLVTSVTGVFTTEEEIRDFFNSSTYSVNFIYEDQISSTLNNSNSTWGFDIAVGNSVTLTVTENMIILDFSTPVEGSRANLYIGHQNGQESYRFYQRDYRPGVYDHQWVGFDVWGQQGASYIPVYDSAFVFPEVSLVREPPHPIDWHADSGGVTVEGDSIKFSGSPTGWRQNHGLSQPFSDFAVDDNFEIVFTLLSDPSDALWMVAISTWVGVSPIWQEMEYALRNANGRLMVYEFGSWRSSGPQLAIGDLISIYSNDGLIEYRVNGETIYSSNYTPAYPGQVGPPDFFVESLFKSGAADLQIRLYPGDDEVPLSRRPITQWVNPVGGVSTSGSDVSYSGSPTGWVNSVNSVGLHSIGAFVSYEISWDVGSDPGNGIWVIGLGVDETRSNWRDVDYAFRNSNGFLTIHESGAFIKDVGALSVDDELSLHVVDTRLDFKLNGEVVHSRSIPSGQVFYVDTAFKNGQAELTSFTLDNWDPVPPEPNTPLANWTNAAGGVSSIANDIIYSGSPTGWVNSINSVPLSTLGAGDDYIVSWVVESDPTNSLWVIGIGDSESGTSWRDIDLSFRNANGTLHLYNGTQYVSTVGQIAIGDELRFEINSSCISFGVNNSIPYINCRSWNDRADLYIDTAFKNGAVQLGNFQIKRR